MNTKHFVPSTSERQVLDDFSRECVHFIDGFICDSKLSIRFRTCFADCIYRFVVTMNSKFHNVYED